MVFSRSILVRLIGSLALLVLLDQLALHGLLSDGYLMGRRIAPFDPPIFWQSQEDSVQRMEQRQGKPGGGDSPRFDAELGWFNPPNGGFGEFTYDWSGARIAGGELEREKQPGKRRIVTIGCSMTHGEEVGALESWPAQLDELLIDSEVANLGVAAYGTDQAVLHLERDGLLLEPDLVLLGFMPAAALRVTTSYRPLMRHWSLDVAFKPRFDRAPDGQLRLLPNPVRDEADILRLLGDQEAFLAEVGAADPWVQRCPSAYAPLGSRLVHHSFLGRLLLTVLESGDRHASAWIDNPNSKECRLLAALVLRAQSDCEARGASFGLVILPSKEDLAHTEGTGRAYWQVLVDRLVEAGVEVIDCTDPLRAKAQSLGDTKELFHSGGHYTAEANRLVAETVAAQVH